MRIGYVQVIGLDSLIAHASIDSSVHFELEVFLSMLDSALTV